MNTRLEMGMRIGTGMLIKMGLGGETPQAFSVSYIIWFLN